ncbi:TetR/AcrR family transcriptional regulator [Streptomyces sp. MP131-18]|uniref:TetR/AcrR family transcriptional regulator n=1 Tax=Streptomyces sp. MP131-18 TaxID=1857892 RepID=UPI00097C88DC|nr:TetR/AcrR family transcriptional regulator [Streptomyces sp. MP131-18]ONK09712.1 Toluene efflux pump ttgABC operon repressor [Streptomyces sp. MP131-18]
MSSSPQPTQVRIVEAAERLMRSLGLARTTTKEIARAAGCSEAALYKHFKNKEEIFVRVLEDRLPRIVPLLADLTDDPGGRDVRDCLTDIARHAVHFYESTTPIAASLFAEPALLQRHREALRALETGPETLLTSLATYLRAERGAGRIAPGADPRAAAALLLGACFQRAFLRCFWDEEPPQPLDEFATALADTVLEGVAVRS